MQSLLHLVKLRSQSTHSHAYLATYSMDCELLVCFAAHDVERRLPHLTLDDYQERILRILTGNCNYVLLETHVCNYYYFLTIGKKKYHPLTKAKQEFALFCITNSNDAIDQTRFNGSSDFTQPFSALIICFLTWFH